MILKIKSLQFNIARLLKAEGSEIGGSGTLGQTCNCWKGMILTPGKELQIYGTPSLTLRLFKPCLTGPKG